MTHYFDPPEPIEINLSIEGPHWLITFEDADEEGTSEIVIGTPGHKAGDFSQVASQATMLDLQQHGHDLYIRYGYAWKFADEKFCPKRFALTEDDCYDAADSMITERDFYAKADAIEAAIELQRDRERGLL